MGSQLLKLKVFLLWFFAIMLLAAQPVEASESYKEVEEVEEVKLFCEGRDRVRKKPKSSPRKKKNGASNVHASYIPSEDPSFRDLRKYILYCNLIFYEC